MPPFAVPSSLVSTRPVTPTASLNCTRLRERVLALVGIEHQQHLVRRGRVDALDARASPSSALPSGATGCAGGRRCRRSARRCRARARTARHRTPPRRGRRRPAGRRTRRRSAPPRCCSCSIAAARNVSPAASITLRPSSREPARELADGGGLARAVDADDQDHERALRVASMTSGRAQGARISAIASRSAAISASTSASSLRATRFCSPARMYSRRLDARRRR